MKRIMMDPLVTVTCVVLSLVIEYQVCGYILILEQIPSDV